MLEALLLLGTQGAAAPERQQPPTFSDAPAISSRSVTLPHEGTRPRQRSYRGNHEGERVVLSGKQATLLGEYTTFIDLESGAVSGSYTGRYGSRDNPLDRYTLKGNAYSDQGAYWYLRRVLDEVKGRKEPGLNGLERWVRERLRHDPVVVENERRAARMISGSLEDAVGSVEKDAYWWTSEEKMGAYWLVMERDPGRAADILAGVARKSAQSAQILVSGLYDEKRDALVTVLKSAYARHPYETLAMLSRDRLSISSGGFVHQDTLAHLVGADVQAIVRDSRARGEEPEWSAIADFVASPAQREARTRMYRTLPPEDLDEIFSRVDTLQPLSLERRRGGAYEATLRSADLLGIAWGVEAPRAGLPLVIDEFIVAQPAKAHAYALGHLGFMRDCASVGYGIARKLRSSFRDGSGEEDAKAYERRAERIEGFLKPHA